MDVELYTYGCRVVQVWILICTGVDVELYRCGCKDVHVWM